MTIMKAMKRIIAITLCLSLVFISVSYVQVSAKYDHTAYMKKVDNYFVKKKVYEVRTDRDFFGKTYECEDYSGYKDFSFVLAKNKKKLNIFLKKLLKRITKGYNSYSYLLIKKPNKKTLYVVAKYSYWYSILVCKVNTKKNRIVVGSREFNHTPKKKRIKKTKKWLFKTVNKLNSF